MAKEVVQEAFIKILLNIDVINKITCHETKSWIVLIIKRISINKLKHENRYNHLEDNVLEYTNLDNTTLEEIAIQHITMDTVLYALKMLDGKYSAIIILRYDFGYTDSKLAQHFNVSPANVRTRCERGKKKLMLYLMDNGVRLMKKIEEEMLELYIKHACKKYLDEMVAEYPSPESLKGKHKFSPKFENEVRQLFIEKVN